jgi:hypothetical protein
MWLYADSGVLARFLFLEDTYQTEELKRVFVFLIKRDLVKQLFQEDAVSRESHRAAPKEGK